MPFLICFYLCQGRGLPWWFSGKESSCQCRRCGFHPWVGKVPWRRAWHPTPVFLPGESHEQRSLACYSPWGCKELDTTEWTNTMKMNESWMIRSVKSFRMMRWGWVWSLHKVPAITHSPTNRKNEEGEGSLTLSLPSSPVLWNAQEELERPQDASPLTPDWHGSLKTNAFQSGWASNPAHRQDLTRRNISGASNQPNGKRKGPFNCLREKRKTRGNIIFHQPLPKREWAFQSVQTTLSRAGRSRLFLH